MSATPPARAPDPAAGNSTRLLLDELDELMQKMLALPVNQLGENDAPLPAPPLPTAPLDEPRVSPPEPPRAPHFIAVPFEPTVHTDDTTSFPLDDSSSAPDSDTSVPPAPNGQGRDTGAIAEDFSALAERPPRAPLPRRATPSKSATVSLPRPPGAASSWTAPLVWCNRLFDRGTQWLGPTGQWLRSVSGRAILGWVGLALWAAALLWGVFKWF